MTIADEKVLNDVKQFIDGQKLEFTEKEEQKAVKITVNRGGIKAHISIFNTGTIKVEGSPGTPLKALFEDFKKAYESGETLPHSSLPPEINNMVTELKSTVPTIDPVILSFIEEAIQSYKANCVLSSAFMLGAASEKAIYLLVDSYANSIQDQTNQNKFKDKVSKNKIITAKWDAFCQSYAGCKSKPTDPILSQDLNTLIGNIFHFCRITRNEIGHPQTVPSLNKGSVLANIGNFVQYVDRIYQLMDFFRNNGVVI